MCIRDRTGVVSTRVLRSAFTARLVNSMLAGSIELIKYQIEVCSALELVHQQPATSLHSAHISHLPVPRVRRSTFEIHHDQQSGMHYLIICGIQIAVDSEQFRRGT